MSRRPRRSAVVRLARHYQRHGSLSLVKNSALALVRSTGSYGRRLVRPLRLRVAFLRRTWFLRRARTSIEPCDAPRLIVSLTTFPARIRTVWATIETLFLQEAMPDAIVLVLSDEEFPDRRLPSSIRRLERRGLIVLWTGRDLGSYDKLIPTRRAFPEATIVTVDDDCLYSESMLGGLLAASSDRPSHIVGHRGRDPIVGVAGRFQPYVEWKRAGPESDTELVLLTGLGGILYPPNAALDGLLLDVESALRHAPIADDVWFWGAARAVGIGRYCTAAHFGDPNGLDGVGPTLFERNRSENDVQIAAVAAHLTVHRAPRSPGSNGPVNP